MGLLRWDVPRFPFPPHGLSGATALAIGTVLLRSIPFGQFSFLHQSPLVILYFVFAAANAISGLRLRAPRAAARRAFRASAKAQLALLYLAARFHPRIGGTWAADVLALVGLGGLFLAVAEGVRSEERRQVKVALVVGAVAFALFCWYPVHLVLGGTRWLECLDVVYPDQRLALSMLVYFPTSVIFAIIMFAATLKERRIISNGQFAGLLVVTAVGVLATTIISQEYYLWSTTTQMLFLPCPPPAPRTWRHSLMRGLNSSIPLRHLLRHFGVDVPLL